MGHSVRGLEEEGAAEDDDLQAVLALAHLLGRRLHARVLLHTHID
jgi:hypothetical protein